MKTAEVGDLHNLLGKVQLKTADVDDLYVLLDGTHAAAGDCVSGDDGVLCGPNGVPVGMTDEGEPMTVKRQAELGGNAMAVQMGEGADGELLATIENQVVDAGKPDHGALAQGMMPAAEKPAAKPAAVPTERDEKKSEKKAG